MQRRSLLKLAGSTLALGPLAARAQAFPARPVKLIVAFPAGGPTDITMRQLADNAGKILGQPVIVENKPGAGGTLPAQALQSSAADGYTVAQIPLGVFRMPYTTKINWDPVKDISYVINVTGYAFGLVVPSSSPIKTWADFVAYAKANPGKLTFGSTGTLTSPHLTMEQVAQKLGLQLTHVPYKGSADLMQAVLGGHVMAAADSTGFAPRSKAASCACSTPGASNAWPSSPTRPRSRSWGWIWCRTRPSASVPRAARRPRWSSACTTPSRRPWKSPAMCRPWAVTTCCPTTWTVPSTRSLPRTPSAARRP